MSSNRSDTIRFLFRAAAFLTIQAAIASVVIWHGTPQGSTHYLSSMQDKVERLEQCQGDRLLVLGGSNVAFGIHSPELQQATGIPTVNLGLHVALGLDYYLAIAEQHLRPGDTIVLIPEYELLIGELQQGDPGTIRQLLQYYPGAARYIDDDKHGGWKQFLDRDALCQAHQWVKRALRQIRRRDDRDSVYQRSSFNAYGDITAHYDRTADDQLQLDDTLPDFDSARLSGAITRLNDLARLCRRRGVAIYYSYPPLMDCTYQNSAGVISQVQATLQRDLSMPILDQPQDVVFSSDCFFDTGYHLLDDAGAQRTEAIARALNKIAQRESKYR